MPRSTRDASLDVINALEHEGAERAFRITSG
jgi:hypothetical protein